MHLNPWRGAVLETVRSPNVPFSGLWILARSDVPVSPEWGNGGKRKKICTSLFATPHHVFCLQFQFPHSTGTSAGQLVHCLSMFYIYMWLCLVTQSCPALCNPMDCSRKGSSVHGGSSDKNTGVGCHALLQGMPSSMASQLRDRTQVFRIAGGSFAVWNTREAHKYWSG